MKSKLIFSLIALSAILLLAFVMADEQNLIQNNSNASSEKTIKNMTFGQCVADAVKIKQECFEQQQQTYKTCLNASKTGKDKQAAKTCLSDGKQAKNSCKTSFKDAKKICIQQTKPNFWQRMRFAFV